MVEALPAAGISSAGLLLVALPLTLAVRLHGIALAGKYLLLYSLVITWIGDTAAYFVGRAIGRHPFAPHLSPKKSWEGAAASFASSVLVAIVIGGLMFMFGEAGAKRQISGIVFGGGLALFAAQFLLWLF